MLVRETTKPTIIAHEGIDLSALHQLRCDHLKVQQETADGKKHRADQSLKALWPEVSQISRDILLHGPQVISWEQSITPAVRQAVLKVLPLKGSLPDKAARASTPLRAEVFKAWGDHTEDADPSLLAKWLQQGAPLGFKFDWHISDTVTGPAAPARRMPQGDDKVNRRLDELGPPRVIGRGVK